MNEPTEIVGVVAHTANNQARRYFEHHPRRTPPWWGRGEARSWSELHAPELWTPGHEVRP